MPSCEKPTLSRRALLRELGGGLGGVALAALMNEAQAATNPLAPRPGHHPAKARAVIQIFCPGGLSHVDTWDYKPELAKRQGKPFDPDGKLQFFASKPGNCQGSFWPFRQHGQCGRWMSDLFPKLATCVDDIAFIHSMQSKSALHGPAMFMANSGFILPGFPSMGAWVTYGLGSISEDLPAFVVLPDPRGLPPAASSTGAQVSCPPCIKAPRSKPMWRSRPSPIFFRRKASPTSAARPSEPAATSCKR